MRILIVHTVDMNCYVCGGDKHPQNWYNDMCKQHRSEYIKEKMRLRVEKKKELIRIYGKEPCKTHNYMTLDILREQCKECGVVIRKRNIKREPYRLSFAEGIHSQRYFSTLNCYHMAAPQRFPPVSTDAQVANILYYLRYDRNWDADRIVKVAHMSHGVLNRYIIRFPWYPNMKNNLINQQ